MEGAEGGDNMTKRIITSLTSISSISPEMTFAQVVPVQIPAGVINSIEEPVIHNIVATANFCCNLDLAQIVVRVRNAEYNPKRFRAVIMRIFEPRTTAMLFSSGKIVCTGAKSERLACIAARKYGRIMQKLGYSVSFQLPLPRYAIYYCCFTTFRSNLPNLRFKTLSLRWTSSFPFV